MTLCLGHRQGGAKPAAGWGFGGKSRKSELKSTMLHRGEEDLKGEVSAVGVNLGTAK